MHIIQEKLLQLSKNVDLSQITLREMAKRIQMSGESPQKIKHHLLQLQKKGFFKINRNKGIMKRTDNTPGWAKGLLKKTNALFSIPIVGTANCGPATIFAEQNFQGFLKISSKLIGRSKPTGLYAIKSSGSSMNRAEINGKYIEDGDFVIVDSQVKSPKTGDVIVTIIDNQGTIKRFIDDRVNGQIILKADSLFDYEPIYLHPDDDFNISGKVVNIIKNLKYNRENKPEK